MVTKRALPQTGLLPQVDNDAVLPVHNVVAAVSWRYQPLLAREWEAREGAASRMDTALKNGASGSVLWVTKRALPQAGLLPQVDNGAALPVHNVVAVVSWRYQPLLAREREAREGAAAGMDTALKSGASGSVFMGD